MDDGDLLLAVADRLERLARRTAPGEWRIGGLLASRPEEVAVVPLGEGHVVAVGEGHVVAVGEGYQAGSRRIGTCGMPSST